MTYAGSRLERKENFISSRQRTRQLGLQTDWLEGGYWATRFRLLQWPLENDFEQLGQQLELKSRQNKSCFNYHRWSTWKIMNEDRNTKSQRQDILLKFNWTSDDNGIWATNSTNAVICCLTVLFLSLFLKSSGLFTLLCADVRYLVMKQMQYISIICIILQPINMHFMR